MAWWKTAKVGDPVVCVDDDWHGPYFKGQPVIGQVLVIHDMIVVERLSHDGCPVFLNFKGSEGGYNAICFRPVQPKSTETGMKMIRKLLDSVPVKEDA